MKFSEEYNCPTPCVYLIPFVGSEKLKKKKKVSLPILTRTPPTRPPPRPKSWSQKNRKIEQTGTN